MLDRIRRAGGIQAEREERLAARGAHLGPRLATTTCRCGARQPGPSSAAGGSNYLPVRWRHPSRRIERGERLAATTSARNGPRPPAGALAASSSAHRVRRHPLRRAAGGRRLLPRPATGRDHLPVRRAASRDRHAAPPTAGGPAASISCMTCSPWTPLPRLEGPVAIGQQKPLVEWLHGEREALPARGRQRPFRYTTA